MTHHLSDVLDAESDPASRLSLAGDTAIVTGAAGGIGSAVASGLALAGADVALVDRDSDGLAAVDAALGDVVDSTVTTVETDLTDESAIEAMVEQVVDRFGAVDVLLNVAGITSLSEPEHLDLDTWNLVMEVNLTGAFLCCRESYPHLAGGGRIVNIASTAGIYGYGDMAHYAAGKSGLITLTRSLASSWASDDVRVNAIAPGLIYTPVAAESYGIDPAHALDRETVDRDAGSPHEIADAAVFLASPASSYVTGETVTVGGPPPDQADVFPDSVT